MTPTSEQTAEERANAANELKIDISFPCGDAHRRQGSYEVCEACLDRTLEELISLRLTNQRLEAEAERFQSRLQGMSDAIVEKDATASKLRLEVERMKGEREYFIRTGNETGEYVGKLLAKIESLELELEKSKNEVRELRKRLRSYIPILPDNPTSGKGKRELES